MSDSALRMRKLNRIMQKQTEVKADRISALLDLVLCHILPYLPTKNVVATSLLARRWKLVWTSLQKLYFDDRQSRRLPGMMGDPMPGFEEFVEIMLTGTHSTNITTFFVHCSRPIDLATFHLWVYYAVRRNAREIELYLDQNHRVELPEELNDEGPTTKFVISSSTLKRYTLWVATEGEMFTLAEYKVKITTPSLKHLHIMSDIVGKFLVHDFNSLTDVILDIVYGEWSRADPNRAIQLLQRLNNTKNLTVSYSVLCALDHADHYWFPALSHLHHLEVAIGVIGWAVLLVILSSSVHLQSLVLRKQSRFEVTEEQFWLDLRRYCPKLFA